MCVMALLMSILITENCRRTHAQTYKHRLQVDAMILILLKLPNTRKELY